MYSTSCTATAKLALLITTLAMVLPSTVYAVDWSDGDGLVRCPVNLEDGSSTPMPAGSVVEFRILEESTGTLIVEGTCAPGELKSVVLGPGNAPLVTYEARRKRPSDGVWSEWASMMPAPEVASLPPFLPEQPAAPALQP